MKRQNRQFTKLISLLKFPGLQYIVTFQAAMTDCLTACTILSIRGPTKWWLSLKKASWSLSFLSSKSDHWGNYNKLLQWFPKTCSNLRPTRHLGDPGDLPWENFSILCGQNSKFLMFGIKFLHNESVQSFQLASKLMNLRPRTQKAFGRKNTAPVWLEVLGMLMRLV